MSVTPLPIPSSGLRLAGFVHRPAEAAPGVRGGVVVCHPHPEYGGTMENPLVLGLATALCRQGLVALRFDFRGAGRSQGHYGGGEAEVGDVRAALDAVAGLPGVDPSRLGVAGYSFGAWVGLEAGWHDARVAALVAVAPPLSMLPMGSPADRPKPLLAVVGSRDAYCPIPALEAWLPSSGGLAERVILEGADHFLAGREDEIGRLTARFLGKHLSAPPVPSSPA